MPEGGWGLARADCLVDPPTVRRSRYRSPAFDHRSVLQLRELDRWQCATVAPWRGPNATCATRKCSEFACYVPGKRRVLRVCAARTVPLSERPLKLLKLREGAKAVFGQRFPYCRMAGGGPQPSIGPPAYRAHDRASLVSLHPCLTVPRRLAAEQVRCEHVDFSIRALQVGAASQAGFTVIGLSAAAASPSASLSLPPSMTENSAASSR